VVRYLQHQHQAKGQELSPGDKVVFYETATGKPHLRDGSKELVRLKPGRQAVIGIAEVSGPLRSATIGQNVRGYADGTQRNWLGSAMWRAH